MYVLVTLLVLMSLCLMRLVTACVMCVASVTVSFLSDSCLVTSLSRDRVPLDSEYFLTALLSLTRRCDSS